MFARVDRGRDVHGPNVSAPAPAPLPRFNVAERIAGLGAGLGALTDFLTSALYGAPRGPIPANVIARAGWIAGGI